jgi:UDP-galactopyranose mutase
VPIPINLDTINTLYGLDLTSAALTAWFAGRAERVEIISTSEDVVVSVVGRELYEKFYQGYTRKQWGLDPSLLDKSITARVPIRTNRDDRYFTDTHQCMPQHGYTRMFERMLDHPNIAVMLGTDYRDIAAAMPHKRLIYTGPIDEYFDFRFGKLPYRSLRFDHETLDQEWALPTGTTNYPQTEDFTRISEYKHMTGQVHPKTAITREFPSAEGDPLLSDPPPRKRCDVQAVRGAGNRDPRCLVRRAAGDLSLLQHGPGDRPGAGDFPAHRRSVAGVAAPGG